MNSSTAFMEKIFVKLLLSFGLAGMVIWFGLLPQIKTFNARQNTLNEKQYNLNQHKDKLAILENTKKNWNPTQEMIDRVDKMWPDQDNVSDFIVQLEAMAQKNGVILNSLSITESIVKETKSTGTETKEEEGTGKNSDAATPKTQAKTEAGTKFSFDTSASYNTLTQIMLDLENFPRFNSLDTLTIGRSSNTDGLSLKINGQFYAK